jgi:hypothetical protein
MLDDIPCLKPGRDPQTIAGNVITLIKAGFSPADAKASALAVAGVKIPDGLSVIRFKVTPEGLLHSQIDTAIAPTTEPKYLPDLKSGELLEIVLENGRTLVKHGFSKHSAIEIAFGVAGYPLPSPFAGATRTKSSCETNVDDAPVDLNDQELQEILARYRARKTTKATEATTTQPEKSSADTPQK